MLGDLLELLQWRALIDGKVSTPARSHLEVALQDRGTHARIDLFKHDVLASAVPQRGLASSRTDIAGPVRLLAKHRHEVPLSVVLRDHHRERKAPAITSLQFDQATDGSFRAK